MPTESNHDKPSRQDSEFNDFKASEVIVVLEDDERSPEVIKKRFQLRARYSPHTSVVFRLFPVTDSMPAITTSCLQIEAGDIESLKKNVYDTTNTKNPGPAYLKDVCVQLHDIQSVTCLRFQLHSRSNIKIIKQFDSNLDNPPGDAVLDTCASLQSLTAASLFSLCFRHDILPRKTFRMYAEAIKQFPDLPEIQKKWYKGMVDGRRLYQGTGHEVHRPGDHHSPSPTRDRCSPPAPGTPASCGGSTIPFDESPPYRGYRGSPPPYDVCVAEGQSPRSGSDAAVIFVTSPGGDGDLPEYGDTERRDDMLDPLQGVFPCGNDTDIRPITKRKWSVTTLCATTTSATDAPRPEKLQRSLSVKSDDESLHELQHQQIGLRGQQSEELQKIIEQLQKTVGQLQKTVGQLQNTVGELNNKVEVLQGWKKTHENRVEELEDTCLQLAERQDDANDAIGSLSHDVDELGGKHDELGNRMLDVDDEIKDMMEDAGRKAQEEICRTIDDSMAKRMHEIVDAQVNEVKWKIWEAIRPI